MVERVVYCVCVCGALLVYASFSGQSGCTIQDCTSAAGLISGAVRNYLGSAGQEGGSTSYASPVQSVYSPAPASTYSPGQTRHAQAGKIQASHSMSNLQIGTRSEALVGLAAVSVSTPNLSAQAKPRTEEEEAKRKRMRANVIKELTETEVTYYTHLKTLLFSFVEPLKTKKFSISDPLIVTLFSFLPPIANLTKEIVHGLQTKTREAAGGEKPVDIGDIFLHLAPVLKMYENYLNNYDSAIQKFKEIQGESSQLDNFVKKFCEETGQQDVTFYFIMPIQRLPRYEMLLREILKYTDEAHPDHSNLQVALEKIKLINDFLNDQKREDDNRRKINELQNNLITGAGTPMALFQQGRYYLREGLLEFRDKKRKKKEFHYFFLLSDILLRTKPGRNSLYHWKQTILLKEVVLTDLPPNDKEGTLSFELTEKTEQKYALVFLFRLESEKQQWLSAIQKAIGSLGQVQTNTRIRDMNTRSIALRNHKQDPALQTIDELMASFNQM
eukprot:TRINITY_DN2409_c1_g1_i1.p1 TRINITY_DN2409_c1_g1~~TRINITY_DN2409_c1_g1_i1.p1  ORF type:complete len:500 (+),score=101.11 TRINITY_DN2409_c1_g1_i1:8-1507(+)